MALYIEAPATYPNGHVSIFLAGSIENGTAEDWQTSLSKLIEHYFTDDVVMILNPRRKNWNPDADRQELVDQITWEQGALEAATMVCFYFDPKTKSPISLLELGQMLGTKPVVVFCPEEFFRYTNVQVTCSGYNVSVHTNIETFVEDIFSKLSQCKSEIC
jgi:hypothetical protein